MAIETAAIKEFLGVAEETSKIVPDLLRENKVYMPAEKTKTDNVRSIIKATVRSLSIAGAVNLKSAWDLVQAGELLKIISNHQSDTDHSVKREILERIGLKEFADRIFYLGGTKMIRRPKTMVHIPAENILIVCTPGEIQGMKTAMSWIREGLLSQEDETIAWDYIENMGALGRASSAMYKQLTASGMVPAFCPEATRTRDPERRMGRAPLEIGFLVTDCPDAYILPWVIDGTTEIMDLNDVIRLDGAHLRSVTDEAFPAREILESETADISFNGSKVTTSDILMARLAILMPDLVKPEELSTYQRLCFNHKPKIPAWEKL